MRNKIFDLNSRYCLSRWCCRTRARSTCSEMQQKKVRKELFLEQAGAYKLARNRSLYG